VHSADGARDDPSPEPLFDAAIATDGLRASGRQHPVQDRHADGSLTDEHGASIRMDTDSSSQKRGVQGKFSTTPAHAGYRGLKTRAWINALGFRYRTDRVFTVKLGPDGVATGDQSLAQLGADEAGAPGYQVGTHPTRPPCCCST